MTDPEHEKLAAELAGEITSAALNVPIKDAFEKHQIALVAMALAAGNYIAAVAVPEALEEVLDDFYHNLCAVARNRPHTDKKPQGELQ